MKILKVVSISLILFSLSSCASLWGNGKKESRRPALPTPPIEQKVSKKEKAEGYYQIGIAYLELGEIPLSLNYLFKAKKLSPDDPKVYNAIGLAFIRRGDLNSAEKYLRRALSLKPNFSEAWLNMGILYEEKGNFKKARECYQKALSNPLYLTPEVAYYRLALLDEKQGNLDRAKRELILAIRNNSDYVPAYLELAKVLKSQGDVEKAKEIYYRLIELYPDLQQPYCELGRIYRKEGDTDRAVKFLKKCIEVKPDSPLASKARMELDELNESSP